MKTNAVQMFFNFIQTVATVSSQAAEEPIRELMKIGPISIKDNCTGSDKILSIP